MDLQDNFIQQDFIIEDAFHNQRLDTALASLYTDLSRTILTNHIKEGLVSIDEQVISKPSFKLCSGQRLSIRLKPRAELEAVAENLDLDIVYQDQELLVINKPVGLVVHPGAGINSGTLMNALLYHFPQTSQLPRAGIVHRLDKDTSGLMVVALTEGSVQRLVKAISKHLVVREYEAICEGLITAGGTIDAPISRDPSNRLRMAVVPEGLGKEAITHFRVMEQFREHTHLKLRLETGRTHQIRVHMASIHHPLLGDNVYGGRRLRLLKAADEQLNDALRAYRHQALHASHIEFEHPLTGQTLSFEVPLPAQLQQLIDLLREDYRHNADPSRR